MVEREILRPEPSIPPADVEAEEGRVNAERLPQADDGVVQVRAAVAPRRAEVQRLRSTRIRRVEIAAPRLDHTEALQVVKRERDGSVAARREADQRTRPAIRNRPEVGVDVGRELLRDRALPVSARAPIEVLGIRVVISRPLRGNQDRLAPQAGERVLQEADAPVGPRRRRQAVEEVDDRVAEVAADIARRQEYDEMHSPADGLRLKRGELGRWPARATRLQSCLGNGTRRDQRNEQECPGSALQRAESVAAGTAASRGPRPPVHRTAPPPPPPGGSSRAAPTPPPGRPAPPRTHPPPPAT